jgi:hypothetical protein
MNVRLFAGFVVGLSACAPSERASSGQGQAEEPCAAADGDWGWQKLGVVGGLPEAAAAGDGILAPALVATPEHGVLHLWYTQKTGSKYALFHATSVDQGATFASPTELTGLPLGGMNAYASVWLEPARGQYHLVFGSGTLAAATSDDGVAFTLAPVPVLRASFDAQRFDALSVLYPTRVAGVATDPAATLFFSGFDGRNLRIGRATEQADGTFAVDPPRPVIDLGAASDFDNAAVAEPHVERAFGRWWMWYGGYDTSRTNPGPYRIGSASSDDGITWKKHGVAIDLGKSGTDAWSTRDPALVVTGGRRLMFYAGLGDDGRYRLHRAATDQTRNVTCLSESHD